MSKEEAPAPNAELKCTLCGEVVNTVCMLSPDGSAMISFIDIMRYHLEHEHGYEKQIEIYTVIPMNLYNKYRKLAQAVRDISKEADAQFL